MTCYRLLSSNHPIGADNPLDGYDPGPRNAILVAHRYDHDHALELWREPGPIPSSLAANDRERG